MRRGPVLVTGAGGFVCSEVAHALHRAGWDVVATDRSFDAPTRARLVGVRLVEGGLEAVLSSIGPLAAVVHGAALTAGPDRLGITPAAHLAQNMGMLTATLDCAATAGATRFLFLSSMGVFEPGDGPTFDARFTEDTLPSGTCTYCAAKRAGEIVTAAAADHRMATLSLRLGNIVGPFEAARESRQILCLIQRMLAQARGDGVITLHSPNTPREWAWLPDLADGIAALLAADDWPGGVRHAGNPPVISDLALAKGIAARLTGVLIKMPSAAQDQIRPPMASIDDLFADVRWTLPDVFLDALIAQEGAE